MKRTFFAMAGFAKSAYPLRAMQVSDSTARKFPWFGTRAGRRYRSELFVLVVAKLAALALLYFAFIAPQPRVDTSPASMLRHMFDAGSATKDLSR